MEPKHLSLDENNIPQEQFGGLTIHQIYALVNEPLSAKSPIRINAAIPDYILDHFPFFKSCEDFLTILAQPGGIKLTASGVLPKQVLISLYNSSVAKHPEIGDQAKTVRKIGDWNFLDSVCQVCLISGLLKITGQALMLTKKGMDMRAATKRTKLFETLLAGFGNKFNWAYNDGYTEAGVGQVGWAYTIFMLMQYGEKTREKNFYADLYFKAFPMMLEYFEDEYIPVEEEAYDCYNLRAIQRFAAWWGFTTSNDTDFTVPETRATRTIYDQLYDVFTMDELQVIMPGTGTYD